MDQTKPNTFVKKISNSLEGDNLVELLIKIKEWVRYNIKPVILNQKDDDKILWKRSGNQIIKEKFTSKTRGCTDYVIAFLTLCRAKNIKANFLKVRKGLMLHSLAEVIDNNRRIIVDLTNTQLPPIYFNLTYKNNFNRWRLLKRGKDSWSLSFKSYKDLRRYSKR